VVGDREVVGSRVMKLNLSLLPRPLAVTCPKCAARPGCKCTAMNDDDWMNTAGWRLMPRTKHTEEAHLHIERFLSL